MGPLFAALDNESDEVCEAASLALQRIDRERESQISFADCDDSDFFSDLTFLEEWFSPDVSLSEVLLKQNEWQVFSQLAEYIKDMRGGVKAEFKETIHGPVLLLHCFYEHPGRSLRETLLPLIQGMPGVDSIESALQSRDEVVRAAVMRAFEIKKKRGWLDLLVVSVSFARSGTKGARPPLRVVLCSMSCHNVREQDVLLLDQLSEQWRGVVDESLDVHNLAELKVWCQSVA